MNEEQIKNLEAKIDLLQVDVKKMKNYFLWTFWVTIILFVLPLIGLFFVIPTLLGSFSAISDFGL